ncbi:glycosyltransferase [Kordia sp.]|uniref:glycosyltransferase family 2 protein n=1 Tax=Kordia sp. TaxID=1965332 RepID=UPI003D6B423B
MKIITVIVTHNRCALLRRALQSVKAQHYSLLDIFVISNSYETNKEAEQILCQKSNCTYLKNKRTSNYAGALNTAIEAILKKYTIADDLYIAFLDDDDAWHKDYLETIANSEEVADIYLANINRISSNTTQKLQLPKRLSYHDFLIGNPGVGGSNTFVRLKTLLKAGCFDEAMQATVDRDIFIRLLQLKPTYHIIPQHLVNIYVDEDRPRVTTNSTLKKESYQYFYYKYKAFMEKKEESLFFARAQQIFDIPQETIQITQKSATKTQTNHIGFNDKKDFFFVIGFIAGDIQLANRILKNIETQHIPVDLVLIINNTSSEASMFQTISNHTQYKIISKATWQQYLRDKMYGSYFSKFTTINSIAIGRTILQYHLYHETRTITDTVYWIIDDDVRFTNTFKQGAKATTYDLFSIINQYKNTADALIGSVSLDAPLPMFSCIRSQLVDLWYSTVANTNVASDAKNISALPDYYYDLTDAHTQHTETPMYYNCTLESDLVKNFSGKAISRPALQQELNGIQKLATNRGPNTLVFNRELLRSYPVVSLEVNDTFTRRGDLSWALMSQVFSKYDFVVHTMALDQNRPIQAFRIEKELNKSANDIIGYAFNKALLATVAIIKQEKEVQRPIHIIASLANEVYADMFYKTFKQYIQHRKARFLMNYYRIYGILQLLKQKHADEVLPYSSQFDDNVLRESFLNTIEKSLDKAYIQTYLSNLGDILWSYTSAITHRLANETINEAFIKTKLQLTKNTYLLGEGSEGKVFTDTHYIYKIFFAIREQEWFFLQQQAIHFEQSDFLETLTFHEVANYKYIRYAYHAFQSVKEVTITEITAFLRFCYQHRFVFTNIKPKNFIRTETGQLKLIDYGKSFETYTEERFINSIKRACLFVKFPSMEESKFKKYIKAINANKQIKEIENWKQIWETIQASSPKILVANNINSQIL